MRGSGEERPRVGVGKSGVIPVRLVVVHLASSLGISELPWKHASSRQDCSKQLVSLSLDSPVLHSDLLWTTNIQSPASLLPRRYSFTSVEAATPKAQDSG